MSAAVSTSTPQWMTATQRLERPALEPIRGHHRATAIESLPATRLRRIPKDLGDRLREQAILSTPGVAEGFDEANAAIEDWKRSL